MRLLAWLPILAVLSCDEKKCADAVPAATAAPAVASSAAAPSIRVAPSCDSGPSFTVLMKTTKRYTGGSRKRNDTQSERTVWAMRCFDARCSGAYADIRTIDGVDGFNGSSLFEAQAKVVSSMGSVHVLRMPSGETLTVDLSARKVTYSSSEDDPRDGTHLEARGEGSCDGP